MLLHLNYVLSEVDYEDKNMNKNEDINNEEQDSHKDDIEQDERLDAE